MFGPADLSCQDKYSSYRPSDWNEDSIMLWFGKDHHHTTCILTSILFIFWGVSQQQPDLLPSFPVAQSCNNRIQNLLHIGSSCVNTNRTATLSGLHIFALKKFTSTHHTMQEYLRVSHLHQIQISERFICIKLHGNLKVANTGADP